jgi:hypothetical protein
MSKNRSSSSSSMATRTAQRRLTADKALQTELKPLMSARVEKYKGGGTYVQAAGKRIRFMGADSKPTAAV